MKYGFFFSIIFLLSINAGQAQNTDKAEGMTTKFKVYGNCEMCEKRIETAVKIEGVTFADWDMDSKILTVTFDPAKVKPSRLHKAVAAVGHDTETERADDAVYE
ncbi:MAG TPA: heavy-metal-associated domain-containing protein, partial [Saprospiraceae bacterium]|nr:heavy-metal-associated domain-containing protein [Saprospiraceae bacterium]